jgi:phenylglyoxylate dehydrogenase epsilon subunit
MAKRKHLIIGCGPAALAAAQAIRSVSPDDEIKLVTRESSPPYSPAALPYLLSAELEELRLFAKGEDCLKATRAELVCGREAVELLPDKKQVKFGDGGKEEYDKLLIATGSHPWVPAVEGLDAVPLHTFRTFSDFKRIQDTLRTPRTIALYGAGFVAVELAEKLTLSGHSVLVIARSSLLRRYFGLPIRNLLQETLTRRGVRIFTDSPLRSVRQNNQSLTLTMEGGPALAADLLIAATGVAPNALGLGLIPAVAGGLQTGRYMETVVPDVYAAGDVASAPSFFDDTHGVNPILPEAIEHGKVAGYNMAGQKTEYRGWIPWNFLRCFDFHAFNIGLTGSGIAETAEVVEREEGNGFLRLVLRDHLLIGAECFNRPSVNPGGFGYLITRRVPVDGHKDLLLRKPMETAAYLMVQHRRSQSGVFNS